MKLFHNPALIAYVSCGDPDEDSTVKLVKKLESAGADAIALEIPFSDPIADGSGMQAASERALANGMTPDKAIGLLKLLRKDGLRMPVYIVAYFNTVLFNGPAAFVEKAKDAGASGLLVPDLPLEESEELHILCEDAGLGLVGCIAPGTGDERLKKIAKVSGGFLYATAGASDAGKEVPADAIVLVRRAKALAEMPVVAGFGVSEPGQAKEYVRAGADGVLVGIHAKEGLAAAGKRASSIKSAMAGK